MSRSQIIQPSAFKGTWLTLDEAEKSYLCQDLPKLQICELNKHVCLKPLGLGVVDNITISNLNTTPTPETCVIVELSEPFPTVAETMLYGHQTIYLYQLSSQEDHISQKPLQVGGANDWDLSMGIKMWTD